MGRFRSSAVAGIAWLIVAVFPASSGCDSGLPGSELSARPKARPLKIESPAAVRLPQDEPFSIVFSPSLEAPALGGQADGDATATRDGNATASAKVTGGGMASGTFQLGHAFQNESDQQIDLDITAKFHYEYQADATTGTGGRDANVGLSLFARDGVNRLVRSIALVQHATDQGPATRQGDESVHVTVTLAPRDSLNVFLAGNAAVDTAKSGRTAACSLKVSDLKVEVAAHPAPPVRAAADVPK